MEDLVYDQSSGQLLTGSFQDYAMPRADDFCPFELANNPTLTDRNPLGVKGVGEAGTLVRHSGRDERRQRCSGAGRSAVRRSPRNLREGVARVALDARLSAEWRLISSAMWPNLADKRRLPMLLRNAWYIAAWADEIGGDQPLARRICNEPIVLFRDATGRVAALADRCCHRAAPLQHGHASSRRGSNAAITASSSTAPGAACVSPGRS